MAAVEVVSAQTAFQEEKPDDVITQSAKAAPAPAIVAEESETAPPATDEPKEKVEDENTAASTDEGDVAPAAEKVEVEIVVVEIEKAECDVAPPMVAGEGGEVTAAVKEEQEDIKAADGDEEKTEGKDDSAITDDQKEAADPEETAAETTTPDADHAEVAEEEASNVDVGPKPHAMVAVPEAADVEEKKAE